MLCACRRAVFSLHTRFASSQPRALRPKKGKSQGPRPPRGLVDMRTVVSSGGRGGDGCVSFLSAWGNAEAGPDGGDGGNGGDVILEASMDVKDLEHVQRELRGPEGVPGKNKDCHGANAKHIIIKVPVGTLVRSQQDGAILSDMEELGARFIAARGGAGGKGNRFFVSDTRQAPEIAECGAPGEKQEYTLEIRSMAHIGLIGFPNAGKSTLLQAISRARPKVASYPFTTQRPFLGVVPFNDHQQLVVADLPGLIAGAHLNRGLGHAFLRHASRCLALLFVLDLGQAWPQPLDELITLRHELRQYSIAMATQRAWAVAANKMDLEIAQENLPLLRAELPSILEDGEPLPSALLPISARHGTGVSDMLAALRRLYDENVQDNEEDL